MNDIGLIKLPQKVAYSENIRPICLPIKESQNENISGRFMVAAGWGKTNDGMSSKLDFFAIIEIDFQREASAKHSTN